jgi:hypothetical protein
LAVPEHEGGRVTGPRAAEPVLAHCLDLDSARSGHVEDGLLVVAGATGIGPSDEF